MEHIAFRLRPKLLLSWCSTNTSSASSSHPMAAALRYDSSFGRPQLCTSCITSAESCWRRTCWCGVSHISPFKQAHHHTSRQYSTIWCAWSEPPTMQARRFASILTLAGAIRGQSAILQTGAGSQAVVESTPPRP